MLLHDSQPEESKSLVEEKLKKVTTERAPVAGQQPARPDRASNAARSFFDGISSSRTAGGTGAAASSNPVVDQLLRNQANPSTPSREDRWGGVWEQFADTGSGAAAAAGVLTAVDEDNEGDEEAQVPNEFEYFTDEDLDD